MACGARPSRAASRSSTPVCTNVVERPRASSTLIAPNRAPVRSVAGRHEPVQDGGQVEVRGQAERGLQQVRGGEGLAAAVMGLVSR